MIVLGADEIIKAKELARKENKEIILKGDLGLMEIKAKLDNGCLIIHGEGRVDLNKLKGDERACYLVEKGSIQKIQFFSRETNLLYKLQFTKGWPTIAISGVPMHRITRINPEDHAMEMTSLVKKGDVVFDCCTGLGYTAIMAGEKAKKVITVEIDENVLEVAKLNPYSKPLFERKNIEIIRGDSTRVIKDFKDGEFDAVIDDAPTIDMGSGLFSREFFNEVYRVLKANGKIVVYIGMRGFRTGKDYYKGISRKLNEAGFRVERKEFGLIGRK